MHWISWIEYSADFMKFCAVPAGFFELLFIPILFAYIIQLFLDGDLKEISEFLFTPYNEFTQWTHTSRFRIFDYLFPDINLEKGIKRLVGIRRWFDEREDLVGSLMFLSPKLLSVITILFLQIAMFLYGLSVFLALIILSFVGLMKASNLLKEKFNLEKKRIPLIAFVIYCSGEIIGFAISTIRFLDISP